MGAARKKKPAAPAPDAGKKTHADLRHGGTVTRRDVLEAAAKAKAASDKINVEASRLSPAVFCQFVLKDEGTGRGIRLVDMHCEWHDLLSKNERVVIWSATDHGKSSQISVGRVLWEIGKNPAIRILIVCAAKAMATRLVMAIRSYIEKSVELAAVFPHLKRGNLWTQSAITVARPGSAKDPTVQAIGFGSSSVLGVRTDLVMVDDYLTAENTATEKQREASYKWLKSTVEGRKAPNARWWFIGNSWHVRDAMHMYAKEEGVISRKYPVLDEKGIPRWLARWTAERYRKEKINRGAVEALRSLDCEAANDNSRYFPITDIWPALVKGAGLTTIYELRQLPPNCMTITAVDLAFSKKKTADETAIVTVFIDPRGLARILWIDAGKWSSSEVMTRIADHHRRYGSIVWVEQNQAQIVLKQQFQEKNITVPTRGFTTGKNRVHPEFGINGLAASMAQGRWIIPNRYANQIDATEDMISALGLDKEVQALILEMLAWSPESHTGDRLQALWIASEAARLMRGRAEYGKKPRGT